MTTTTEVDVLIVGAGLSGIGAAWYLQDRHPGRTYVVAEARDRLGGTWDLFRYPGVRSDSDMQTLGYRFRPWTGEKALADGPSILAYVTDTAREAGIDRHIRYDRRVVTASWDSGTARWTVTLRSSSGDEETVVCHVMHVCSGYYRYDEGYTPAFAGVDDFRGTVVHPQHWPEDLDPAGRRIVVIGSGATAVTLVPALAGDAAHVTMLQRTPTYIVSRPSRDAFVDAVRRVLPEKAAYRVSRWKNIAQQVVEYGIAQRWPHVARRQILAEAAEELPDGYDVGTHLSPPYDVWDQRVCLIPDGDLWEAISSGDADIVTDQVETFTPDGIRLASGRELEADIVITATGLNLLAFGDIDLVVDGEEVVVPERMAYKGMMLSDVPNYVFTVGYTNASWTLKADLVAGFLGRLLARLDDTGTDVFVPVGDPTVQRELLIDFESGYVQRGQHLLPDAGAEAPWTLGMNYLADVRTLRHGRLEDGVLTFRRARPTTSSAVRTGDQAGIS